MKIKKKNLPTPRLRQEYQQRTVHTLYLLLF